MSSPKARRDAISHSRHSASFGRVLVVVDVTSDPGPALESAATLAAGLDARLVTLFVEDKRLQQLENHPVARAIDLPTGLHRGVSTDSLRCSSRALARRMHDRVASLSQRYRLQARFEMIGGDAPSKIRKFSDDTDLLVVGSSGRHLAPHVRTTSKCHRMGYRLSNPVVFVDAHPRPIRSISVVHDGSDEARRGLRMALQLAQKHPLMLSVLAVGADAQRTETVRREVTSAIRQQGVRVHPHIRRITCCDTASIVRVATNVHSDLVVVPSNDTYPGDDDIDQLTRHLDCPVLVLRPQPEADVNPDG